MSESEKNRGFKVTDRRPFNADGERRQTEGTSEASAPGPEVLPEGASREHERPAPSPSSASDREKSSEANGQAENFLELVSMLANNALVQLGEVPDPASGQPRADLKGAQVMISFLKMLQHKTRGNLSDDEARLLDGVLYDLRMRFMAKAKLINL